MNNDMTLAEFVIALREVRGEMGSSARISVMVNSDPGDDKLLTAILRPHGYSRDHIGCIYADNYRDLVSAVRARWKECREEVQRKAVETMALAIIRLTHEFGECTDAALRQEFDAKSVALYGEEAVKRADEMSDRRPFTIVKLAGANAA